jgi:hypothetical protein
VRLAQSHDFRHGVVAVPPSERRELAPLIAFADRGSDSPVIERVWRSHSEQAGVFHSMAACHWGMVITRLEGRISLTVRGPETKATLAECPPEGEWFGVLFKLGTFMPLFRSGDLRDRKDATLPNATNHSFWLDGSAWDFPTFNNLETFVDRLVRRGLILTDRTVEGAIRGEWQNVATRTEQRRLLRVTGLTRGTIHQIERARRATGLLRQGRPILDVAHETGYYDQAHLTRSLQRFVGRSPGQIAQGGAQLSLLYNNER